MMLRAPALVLALLACPAAPGGADATPVRTVRVSTEDLVRTVRIPGTVLPWEEATILAPVKGVIREVPVRDGARVRRGEVLAVLEIPLLAEDKAKSDAAVRSAVAVVAEAEARALRAFSEVAVARAAGARAAAALEARAARAGRIRRLHEAAAATDEEMEEASAGLAIAEAEVRSAEAAAASAEAAATAAAASTDTARARAEEARADRTRLFALEALATIRCPYESGLVVSRRVDPGALAEADRTPLFRVQNLERLRVRFTVDERDGVRTRAGSPVTVTPDALPLMVLKATLTRTAGAIDPSTRTLAVEVDLDPGDGPLLPGMFVHCDLEVFRRPGALVVPARCLGTGKEGAFVFVVENGAARRVPVTLGLDDGIRVEVAGGLVAGAEVVSSGMEGLQDGMAVESRPEERR